MLHHQILSLSVSIAASSFIIKQLFFLFVFCTLFLLLILCIASGFSLALSLSYFLLAQVIFLLSSSLLTPCHPPIFSFTFLSSLLPSISWLYCREQYSDHMLPECLRCLPIVFTVGLAPCPVSTPSFYWDAFITKSNCTDAP